VARRQQALVGQNLLVIAALSRARPTSSANCSSSALYLPRMTSIWRSCSEMALPVMGSA
jgi:hypothetical protein